MTANQMLPAIGQIVAVNFESIVVSCTVRDVKTSWNKVRLLVAPILGEGEQWVEMPRIQIGEAHVAALAAEITR